MTTVAIPPNQGARLQENLVHSHAAGGGPPFSDDVVRAMMLVRLNCLVKAVSGVSPAVVQLLADMLNQDIVPVVPQQGSLGASGDLAPLAHIALSFIGEGMVRVRGEESTAAEALARAGLRPLRLTFKEGLSLINGTSGMTGAACLAFEDAKHLLRLAILLSADYVQALGGSTRAFDPTGNELKNHHGQVSIAGAVRALLEGSQLMASHSELMASMSEFADKAGNVTDTGVYLQHAYSLRCVPQILGPVVDALAFCQRLLEEEVNSANDNPLIFDRPDTTFHGGNFHGQYVAMACDYMNIALAEVGVLAERQLNRLLDPHLNGSLPPFLALGDPGLFMGMQGAQYLATSICAENLDLAAPSSIKSIPSNGSNQDVVSMGLISARKTLTLGAHVRQILGVLAAACHQASHLRGADRYSPTLGRWHTLLGERVRPYDDRIPADRFIQPLVVFLGSETCRHWVRGAVPGL